MDAEMACAMLNEIFRLTAERGERDRFDALVEEMRGRRPELYAEEKSYFLKWRITNALVAGRPGEVSTMALDLAPLAASDIDIFNGVESRLADRLHQIYAAFPDDPAPLRAIEAWHPDAQRAIPE
jgi:hypothetical protein